jgi:hypothetical protein
MTYYPDLELSSCQVAGAIAEAAIHDLRVNNFTGSSRNRVGENAVMRAL